jgi:hypothetical protein
MDTTISKQKSADSIRSIAFAILAHIRPGATPSDQFSRDFSEETTAIDAKWRSEAVQRPNVEIVSAFIKGLYEAAMLEPETLIVALVYVERVLSMTKTCLTGSTWRPVVGVSIILAAKVWNDLAVWNADFQNAWTVKPADAARLEVHFLEHIRYSVVVTAQQYARYYFELRNLPDRTELLKKISAAAAAKHEKTIA